MPELPEVETIRRDLQRVLKGKKIAGVVVRKRRLIKSNQRTFGRDLKGQVIDKIKRRGKLLIVELGSGKRPSYAKATEGKWLLIHLKMTGQLIYQDAKKTMAGGHGFPLLRQGSEGQAGFPGKYTHIVLTFSDKSKLFFNDLRQFGYMKLVNEKELKEVLDGYGVEPLKVAFTVEELHSVLQSRTTAVKNVLLNQTLIAGLGNIYVDESCFLAGIRPTRRANKVTGVEVKRLHGSVQKILRLALKERGTTFGTYRDGLGSEGNFVRLLKVYGRVGEKCRKCRQSIIKRVKVSGRGTAYCPTCQK